MSGSPRRRRTSSAIRVSAGKADLILGCDLVVSGARKVLAAVRENHTIFVANTAEIMPGEFARSADFSLPVERLKKAIRQAAGEEKAHFFDATRTASALFGNSLGANMFMLGFAYQHGGLPLSAEAIEKAIELNGEAVAMNIAAFRWGRRAAHEPGNSSRPGRAVGAARYRAGSRETLDEIVAPARGVSRRLSGCRLCAALRSSGSPPCARPKPRPRPARRRSPKRSPETFSS